MRIIFYFVVVIIFSFSEVFATSMMSNKPQEVLFDSLVDKTPKILAAIEDVLLLKHGISLKSRVDTGAEGSSLHAEDVQVLQENGVRYAHFYTLDDYGHRYKMKEKIQDIVEVTNTSGIPEKRYVIRTNLVLKGKAMMGNVNLKDRSRMNFKFLIGRDLIQKEGFLVNINPN